MAGCMTKEEMFAMCVHAHAKFTEDIKFIFNIYGFSVFLDFFVLIEPSVNFDGCFVLEIDFFGFSESYILANREELEYQLGHYVYVLGLYMKEYWWCHV